MTHSSFRGTSAISAALIALLAVTGCSSQASGDESGAGADSEQSSRLPAPEGETQYPLTLDSPWGETTLSERPERVSLAGVGTEIELLAILDVSPSGAADTAGDPEKTVYPWATERLALPVETTWAWDYENTMPAESIARSEPDLIIADNTTTEESYAKLATIAPVLYVGDEEEWQDQLVDIGTVLDLGGAAEHAIVEDDDYWREFRDAHPEFQGKTMTYFIVWGGEYGAAVGNLPGSAAEANFSEWGFEPNPRLSAFEGVDTISPELVSLLDADLLVGLDSSDGDYADLVGQQLFQQLPAVQGGHFVSLTWGDSEFTANGESGEFLGHLGQALNGVTGPLGARYSAETLAPVFQKYL